MALRLLGNLLFRYRVDKIHQKGNDVNTTQERIKQLFYIQEDGTFRRKINVRGALAGDFAGCYRPDGYYVVRVDGRLYRGHHLVWLWYYGVLPEDEIDHIDGDPRNNRISNLRECNRSENICNTKHRKNNTSGYKGVTWSKAANKWIAQIWKNSKRHHLGCFEDPEKAFEAYCKAADEMHKEFQKPTSL